MTILFIDEDREDVDMFCAVIAEFKPDAVFKSLYDCSKLEEYLSTIPMLEVIFLDGYMFPVNGKIA